MIVSGSFLIHRVELKTQTEILGLGSYAMFLIHRVELKKMLSYILCCIYVWFLIHRVELKIYCFKNCHWNKRSF